MREVASIQDLSPEQCKTARFLLGWGQRELASESGVSTPTIVRFERGERVKKALIRALMFSFQEAGVEFRGSPGATTSDTTRVILADGTEVVLRLDLGSASVDENSSS